MSRRRRRDWSASGLPRLRDAWTRALSSELGRQGRDIDVARAHGDQAPAEAREAVRVYDATLPAREALIEHTSRAELYWVTAPMVDLATESALSLPAWTPTTAVPCDAGLLCWQRPATTHLPHPDGGTCTWDAVLWCPHPVADHALLVQALTRTPGGDLPLTPVVEVHVPLEETRRPNRADAGELMISALGAAWLLMGQPAVTELTVDAPGAAESGNERRGRRRRRPRRRPWWPRIHAPLVGVRALATTAVRSGPQVPPPRVDRSTPQRATGCPRGATAEGERVARPPHGRINERPDQPGARASCSVAQLVEVEEGLS